MIYLIFTVIGIFVFLLIKYALEKQVQVEILQDGGLSVVLHTLHSALTRWNFVLIEDNITSQKYKRNEFSDGSCWITISIWKNINFVERYEMKFEKYLNNECIANNPSLIIGPRVTEEQYDDIIYNELERIDTVVSSAMSNDLTTDNISRTLLSLSQSQRLAMVQLLRIFPVEGLDQHKRGIITDFYADMLNIDRWVTGNYADPEFYNSLFSELSQMPRDGKEVLITIITQLVNCSAVSSEQNVDAVIFITKKIAFPRSDLELLLQKNASVVRSENIRLGVTS